MYNFNSFFWSRNPRIETPPIPGVGIGEKGRDPESRDPGIAITKRNVCNTRKKLVTDAINARKVRNRHSYCNVASRNDQNENGKGVVAL